MRVLVLAAGYGTRLYKLVKDTPKALLDVGGKPLVNYITEKFDACDDVSEIILVTNEKFYGHFQEWAKDQKNKPYKLTIVNDGTKTPEDRLGSIGDIDFVLKHVTIDDDLLVVGGDNIFDFNIMEYLDFAKSKDRVTVGLYDIHDLKAATKFGVVSVDETRRITSFEEKPEKPKSTLVGMCFYFIPQAMLSSIPDYLGKAGKADRAGDYIRWLLDNGQVYGFKFEGKWYDIGSIESYKEAQSAFTAKE